MHEPSVLGELLVGILLGNLGYWLQVPVAVLIMHLGEVSRIFNEVWQSGAPIAQATGRMLSARHAGDAELDAVLIGPEEPALVITAIMLWLFSNLGVLFLLFMVGLKSSLGEIRRVGSRPLSVALVGVLTPFALGYAVMLWFRPDLPQPVAFFVAATLCATSLGITARLFEDLDRQQPPEALITLGAAIIDDVLSLIVLAVVVGIVTTGTFDAAETLRILVMSALFFGLIVLFGERAAGWGMRAFRALDPHSFRLVFPVVSMLFLAWISSSIGSRPSWARLPPVSF